MIEINVSLISCLVPPPLSFFSTKKGGARTLIIRFIQILSMVGAFDNPDKSRFSTKYFLSKQKDGKLSIPF